MNKWLRTTHPTLKIRKIRKLTTLIEKNMLFNVNIKRRERNPTSVFKHI